MRSCDSATPPSLGSSWPGKASPEAGYVNDPQLSVHNLQRAAEASGALFRFNSQVINILRSPQRVTGVTLDDGNTITAPVVVNVAGPHSYVINKMAGVYDSMKIKTRALRHEVHHVPAPEGFDFETQGFTAADDDTGVYYRPEVGNHILIGSGNQYKNGPVAGHVMAELITAVEGGLDHDNDPLVVEGRYTGMPIEIGFFSRNREVAATSMTVHG